MNLASAVIVSLEKSSGSHEHGKAPLAGDCPTAIHVTAPKAHLSVLTSCCASAAVHTIHSPCLIQGKQKNHLSWAFWHHSVLCFFLVSLHPLYLAFSLLLLLILGPRHVHPSQGAPSLAKLTPPHDVISPLCTLHLSPVHAYSPA